jgi:hypothetical protein
MLCIFLRGVTRGVVYTRTRALSTPYLPYILHIWCYVFCSVPSRGKVTAPCGSVTDTQCVSHSATSLLGRYANYPDDTVVSRRYHHDSLHHTHAHSSISTRHALTNPAVSAAAHSSSLQAASAAFEDHHNVSPDAWPASAFDDDLHRRYKSTTYASAPAYAECTPLGSDLPRKAAQIWPAPASNIEAARDFIREWFSTRLPRRGCAKLTNAV